MEDIPVMERSALRCAARINNTIPCPNTAMAGNAYCWAHRNLQVAEADDDLLPVDDLTTPPPLASGETNDDETPTSGRPGTGSTQAKRSPSPS